MFGESFFVSRFGFLSENSLTRAEEAGQVMKERGRHAGCRVNGENTVPAGKRKRVLMCGKIEPRILESGQER
ncbi:hypothetical protein L596_008351 [Steinernema carpocapsae]|uniref:Uncharacterized protein n=1 Tax=Steinernema carpocapsae TaxID=34508 RepID=A0A4U5PCH3_STECR|nr:hypothetical protein L596_008351 [Steinernema carpocapsae]